MGSRSRTPKNKVRQVGLEHKSYVGLMDNNSKSSFYPGDNKKLLNNS